jgi:hypothetical protein
MAFHIYGEAAEVDRGKRKAHELGRNGKVLSCLLRVGTEGGGTWGLEARKADLLRNGQGTRPCSGGRGALRALSLGGGME